MIKVPLWIRDLLKRDGSRTLTGDWDIGDGRMIQADKIRARDGDGLKLYEDGGTGIVVKDGGEVGIRRDPLTSMGSLQLVTVGNYRGLSAAQSITDGTSKSAAAVVGPRKNNAHIPFCVLAHYDEGASRIIYLGGGGWGTPDATKMFFYTAAAYNETNDQGLVRLSILADGCVGIGTTVPGNPLAVNRSADGVIVDFESADSVEGSVSIADTTTSYNAFMGSHYTQLKEGQVTPPVGAIVIVTSEIIPCEVHIEVPVTERYYEYEDEVLFTESIEDDIREEQVETGEKQIVYALKEGKLIGTEIPLLKTVMNVVGKKFKENIRLNEKTGEIYKKNDKILEDDEEAPANVTVLKRQKKEDGNPVTEIKAKDVSGIEKKEYFSYVELASRKADKQVYGVYHAKLSDDAKGQSFGKDNKPVHQIAALGLYKVRVTDTNGNISAGNYIQSSIRAGEGERQNDDILHSYTVAKSIISVDWNEVEVDLELGYKWQLIPATLHCG